MPVYSVNTVSDHTMVKQNATRRLYCIVYYLPYTEESFDDYYIFQLSDLCVLFIIVRCQT